MSGSLDTSFLFETIAKDDEVNLPPEVMAREIQKRETRVKKEAQEKALEKKVKSLEKIEKKTEKLLKKAKEAKDSPRTTRTQPTNNSSTTPVQSKREVSFMTLRMMPPRKTPRIILEHIKVNAFEENGDWFSTIDSYELSSLTNKTSDQNGTTVRRLRDQGWFEIIKADSGGFRLVTINPENYGLK